MQYKCRPFFVFMGKTEEFCCPEYGGIRSKPIKGIR